MANASDFAQAIAQKPILATNVFAAGSAGTAGFHSSVQTTLYGEFLTANGFGLLSFAEWFQCIAALWLIMQILKSVFSSPPWIWCATKLKQWLGL